MLESITVTFVWLYIGWVVTILWPLRSNVIFLSIPSFLLKFWINLTSTSSITVIVPVSSIASHAESILLNTCSPTCNQFLYAFTVSVLYKTSSIVSVLYTTNSPIGIPFILS